jgi:hypothetical protein
MKALACGPVRLTLVDLDEPFRGFLDDLAVKWRIE